MAISLRHEYLNVVQGDVLEPQTIREAAAGKDIVVFAVGVRDRAPTTVYSQGVANVISAMQSAHLRGLICISASGIEPGPWWQQFIAKPILWAMFKEMYSDLVRMEAEVEHSPIDWTILRPPRRTNGPRTGKYQVALNKHLQRILSISRADTADFIIRHFSDPATHCARVEIVY